MRIWKEIAGPRPAIVTLVPYKRELVSPGPKLEVYWTYSELVSGTDIGELPDLYFSTLTKCDALGTLQHLATINNVVLNKGTHNSGLHENLHRNFLKQELLEQIARQRSERRSDEPEVRIVFHRLSLLLNMKLILGISDQGGEKLNEKQLAGKIALHANSFISEDEYENDQDLILEALPTWEISNPRDVAYSMARYDFLLKDYLLGTDAQITALRERLNLTVGRFDGLLLDEYLTLIFGIYSLAKKAPGGTIASATVAKNLKIPPESVAAFFQGRSLTIDQFRDKFGGGGWTKKDFLSLVANPRFVKDTTQIRRYPFARINDDTHVVLDSGFVVELLTSGLYWSIFDSLPARPSKDREHFRELWGRAFELYAVGLLTHFYGQSDSGLSPLKPDVAYESEDGNGQIDAALDYGNEVILFEMKASLLSVDAKCGGDWDDLEKELARNLIENEKGKPKALRQLARAAKATIEGRVFGGKAPEQVFPVLVVDEKAMECLAMNSYLNQLFRGFLDPFAAKRIRPLTVMSIDELEELLPYIEQQEVSWLELLSSRFNDNAVLITSVHQALYNINRDIRNSFLLDRFQDMFARIKKLCPPS